MLIPILSSGLVRIRRRWHRRKLERIAGKPFVLLTAQILAWEREGWISKAPAAAWSEMSVAEQVTMLHEVKHSIERARLLSSVQ